MVTVREIEWLAGFLEGEGYFGFAPTRGTAKIAASQVQLWPLEKCHRILGGFISKKHCSQWILDGTKAMGVMMTLYGLMSPRRKQQISNVFNEWKKRPAAEKYRICCPKGHPYAGANLYVTRTGARACLACTRERVRLKREAIRTATR